MIHQLAALEQEVGEGFVQRAQLLAVETTLSEPGGEPLALVKTTWQVKPWSSVRGRS